jgi:hypothetical protein
MPRPKNGYLNAAAQPVPGTTDIIGRYEDKYALMRWHNQQGLAGVDTATTRNTALDIGSVVHEMIERDMLGASDKEIETLMFERLAARMYIEQATASFRAYREWKAQCRVRMLHQERSLVSEKYQYGGTIDLICIINNGIGLIDFKTSNGCKGPYPGQKVQLAAYANLWNEFNPKQELDDYHLLILSKDGAGIKHFSRTKNELTKEWELFKAWRAAYAVEKEKPAASYTIPRFKAEPKAEKPAAAKPRVRVKMGTAPSLGMAEILVAYGHVPPPKQPVQQNIDFRWSRPAQ